MLLNLQFFFPCKQTFSVGTRGAVFTEEHLGAHWEEYTELLKRCLGSVVLPIGSLSVGHCVHRALLFKVILTTLI